MNSEEEAPDKRTQSVIDYTDALAACLTAGGLVVSKPTPVEVDAEGPPSMSQRQVRDVWDACFDQVGPPPEREINEETAERVYDRYLGTVDCLRAKGYEPGDPPSRQVFIDQYLSGSGTWTPYGRWTDSLPLGEMDRLKEECPEWVV